MITKRNIKREVPQRVEDVELEMEAVTPTVDQIREIEWVLSRKLGRFDGENVQLWGNYVGMFEDLASKSGWAEKFEEENLVEFLAFRLEGKARKVFETWTLEDPRVVRDYNLVKDKFPEQFCEGSSLWERMTDFQMLKMEGEEPIEKYVQRYKKLNDSLSSEEKDVIKFFSSLSRECYDLSIKEYYPEKL